MDFSSIAEMILKGVIIFAIVRFLLWLHDNGWLKYLLIAAVLVVVLFWAAHRCNPESTFFEEQGATVLQEQPNLDDSYFRSAWNKGACRTLGEDVYVVAIFINDARSVWYDYTYHWLLENKLEPGMNLIRQESSRYGYPLEMNYSVYRDIKIDVSTPAFFEEQNTHTAFLSAVTNAMGFSSPSEMLDYHQEYFGYEQIAYFFCTNGNGRSYAHRSYTANSEEIEYCVFFTLYDSGWATSHSTVPHEILHLFGAEDMYAEGTQRVNREKLAYQLCPDDVMLGDEHNLPIVDLYTAYTIGWLDTMPAEYNRDDWWS